MTMSGKSCLMTLKAILHGMSQKESVVEKLCNTTQYFITGYGLEAHNVSQQE